MVTVYFFDCLSRFNWTVKIVNARSQLGLIKHVRVILRSEITSPRSHELETFIPSKIPSNYVLQSSGYACQLQSRVHSRRTELTWTGVLNTCFPVEIRVSRTRRAPEFSSVQFVCCEHSFTSLISTNSGGGASKILEGQKAWAWAGEGLVPPAGVA